MSLLTPTLSPPLTHSPPSKNILVLTADIGCGHGRAAAALTLHLRTHHPHHNTTILDALTLCPRWFTLAYRDLYLLGCKHLPKLSGRIYELTDATHPPERSLSHKIESFALSRLVNLPALRQADLVLTTHFLTARVLSHLKHIGRLPARLAVIVTDQHPHSVWRVPHADLFCVASPPAADTLRASGIPASRIRITGIPIDERFHSPLPKHLARERHNLPQDRPIILLSGGGLGLGGIDTALHALLSAPPPPHNLPPPHPLVVCGKNTKLFQQLTAQYPQPNPPSPSSPPVPPCPGRSSDRPRASVPASPSSPSVTLSLCHSVSSSLPSPLPPTILSHTSRMHELMAAADLLLGKPGGLTTSEAAASHLPMVLLKPLPGQEDHNARTLTSNGLAELHPHPHSAGLAAANLAHNPQKLSQMRTATHLFSPPNPTSHAIQAALSLLTPSHR